MSENSWGEAAKIWGLPFDKDDNNKTYAARLVEINKELREKSLKEIDRKALEDEKKTKVTAIQSWAKHNKKIRDEANKKLSAGQRLQNLFGFGQGKTQVDTKSGKKDAKSKEQQESSSSMSLSDVYPEMNETTHLLNKKRQLLLREKSRKKDTQSKEEKQSSLEEDAYYVTDERTHLLSKKQETKM
eukprot:GHVU01157056.1.p1 GENE.GHVU01157056.1~~GHVU01157056.1.p1  ORF type:complete len:186 (+),score=48.55 GHVU01157056.1:454-1011(+)